MSRSISFEVANFHCRFGDDKVLEDYLTEIILPAFSEGRIRSYDDREYFLYKLSLVRFEKNEPTSQCIAGRIIKNTTLTRTQVFRENKGLIPDKAELESAPSSVFVLILAGHRLLYVKEQSDSPSLSEFRGTIIKFLKQARMEYINSLVGAARDTGKYYRGLKKLLLEEHPSPTLELIPLASEQSIRTFISRYNVLKHVAISFIDTNDEIDNDDFFQKVRAKKDAIGSNNTALHHRNSGGLMKDAAREQLVAAKDGNARIKLDGRDAYGDRLIGDNEKFKLKIDLAGEIPRRTKFAARKLFESFFNIVNQGAVTAGRVSTTLKKKLEDIRERFTNF